MNNITAKNQNAKKIKFSIQAKIFFVILVPACILIMVILTDYRNLTILGRSSELILSENYDSIKAAQQVRQLLEATRNQLLLEAFAYKTIEPINIDSNRKIAELLNFCRDNITEHGEKPILDELSKKYDKYQALFHIISLNHDKSLFLNDNFIGFISLSAELILKINELVLINEQAMEKAERDTNQFAQKALRYSIGLLISGILFTLIISFVLSRHISKPLSELSKALSIVKEGSGSYPAIPIKTKDEIGFLTSEFNKLFERLKAYDRLSMEKLLAEKEKVHQAEIAKAKFIADLSHQLKTPMTSLSMSIGLLTEKSDNLSQEKRFKLFLTAKEDCMRLATLISELVDIARLETMVITRQKEVLEIERVAYETLRPLVHQADEKGIKMKILIAKDIPPVAIDSLRFPWVLTNLVGNAIRYTDRGGSVTLVAEKKGQRCYFQCIDTGSGIEPKFVDKIFDRYTQFSEREKSGTIGLGLAIVKEIIEQHGGDISVESRPGKGTAFRFWIPIGERKRDNNENRTDY